MSTIDQQLEITGHTVTIRPMCRDDAEMENDFVRRLSPQTKHYRFFGAVKELSPRELEQFCDVDGHRSMAFVATLLENGREMQIGVSRYAPNADADVREFAITVADDWQHHGLGTRLAQQLIRHAREHGVRKLYSVSLADNSTMRALARDLGMTATPDPEDARLVLYSLFLPDDRTATHTQGSSRQP